MHNKLFIFLFLISFYKVFSQGENCSNAVSLTNGLCVVGNSGLTQNISGCVGNADDDVWYKFVATNTSHSITVTGSANYDAVLQLFSGTCSVLVSLNCVDNTFSGQTESFVASNLNVGTTYFVRTYHYGVGSGSNTFTICLNNPPPAPINNLCNNAITIPVGTSCLNTTGTTYGATQSLIGCTGTANDDVWYLFTATNYTQTIQVSGSASMDAVIELFSGSCNALTSVNCVDNTFSGGTEILTASGLTPGVSYLFRVYDYYSSSGSTFSVCVSGGSVTPGTQPNDEPCNAIQIPNVTADCNNFTFSNVGATASAVPGMPPSTCENYNNSTNTYGTPSSGGYSSVSGDVWFKITVPASGNLFISPIPNQTSTGWIQDGAMAIYRGSCSSLTSYTCSDDYNYPGGYNDLQPFVKATGLIPGEVVYLRYWGYGSLQGNFGFCVQSPTNDLCSNALYICDINGYSATTSPAYTRDHPCNMRGNGEGPAPLYTYSVGANPNGPFGAGGSWGVGSAINDVYIDNNSWVRFTAASPTVSLRVTVSNCWGVGINSITATPGTSRGVQMQIFSASSACCGFVPVSDYKENVLGSFVGGVSTYTVTSNNLTVGNDYYVMVDGWSGDICNYTIQAINGVSFPAITAIPGTICKDQTTILTAPSGATGYTWAPTGQHTQTISVAPGTQITYTCYVGGVCGYRQTLTKTVYLYPTPTLLINSGAPIRTCATQSVLITASGASTYSWSTGNSSASFTTVPVGNTSYTVTGTSVDGCTNTAVSSVTVYPKPIIQPTGNSTICKGLTSTLTVSGANTYTWFPSTSLSLNTGSIVIASPTINTNYTINATSVNGCTNSATYSVNVNPNPVSTIISSGSITCQTNTISLNASLAGQSYTWTAPNGNLIMAGTNHFQNTIVQGYGTYSLSLMNAQGCVYTTTMTTPTNTIVPSLNLSSNSATTTCLNSTASISVTSNAAPNVSYLWQSPITGTVSNLTTSNPILFGSGIFTVHVTNTLNGCVNTKTLSVYSNDVLPSINLANSVILPCNSSSITLSGSSSTNSVSYTWVGPNLGSIISSPNSQSVSVASIGVYTLTVTNTLTGCSSNATISVVSGTLSANFTADPMFGDTPLSVNFTNLSSGANNYFWDFGNGSNSILINPSTVFNTSGTYTVLLIAQTGLCIDSAKKIIVVEDGFSIEIPNVFTPNDDGANDLFHIKCTGVKSAEGSIYNRWGQLLFSWDVLSTSWNGTHNGEKCPDSTYYYIIKAIDKKNKEYKIPGYVLIFR